MTKSITIALRHDLGAEEARRRLEIGLDRLKNQFADKIGSSSVEWRGDRAEVNVSALGQTAQASIEVEAEVVTIVLNLPWLLAAFAERARSVIQKSGEEALRLPPPRA